ncbi:MAG: type II toxin-antitoxin system HipA family toxin [Bdellovibrionales bacterium]|nr:type II toxin-antitoxin system HipA family toxin [Bdellovibrionales bacterium]
MKRPLNVFFEEELVGLLLKKGDDTLSFQYSSGWLSLNARFALSPALPLQEEPFNNRLTKAYFDNLLPEGDFLKAIEKITKRGAEDPHQFLESYGLDCAGALEITPSDKPPPPGGSGKIEKISYDEIDKVIEDGQSLYAHSITAHKGKFSIAGAQDKIPVIFKDGEIYIPLDSTPTTHILKPPARLKAATDTVLNEYLCMSLARRCGLEIPDVQIIGKATPLYLVSRYDRRKTKGGVERVHQFDLCQAQGFPASEKYEEDGGPSFAMCYKCIGEISDNRIHDFETCLNWLAFNLLIGNNDSHSKNLSFVYEQGETKVAPLYDLLSTSIYKEIAPEFAFRIGGQRLWHQFRRKNFQLLARDLGFVKNEDIVIVHILNLASKLEAASGKLLSESNEKFEMSSVPKLLKNDLEKRIRAFREIFGGYR